jgi:hypothetical protein
MQKGMVDNGDDATLSSVDHIEEGFLAAADEETAEIVAWQDAPFQDHLEGPFFNCRKVVVAAIS